LGKHENDLTAQPAQAPFIEAGDVDAALRTGRAIGDDTRCKSARRAEWCPDSFTHGTSEQRKRWFDAASRRERWRAATRFAATQL